MEVRCVKVPCFVGEHQTDIQIGMTELCISKKNFGLPHSLMSRSRISCLASTFPTGMNGRSQANISHDTFGKRHQHIPNELMIPNNPSVGALQHSDAQFRHVGHRTAPSTEMQIHHS